MARGSLALKLGVSFTSSSLLLLLLAYHSCSFYLPGVAPQDFSTVIYPSLLLIHMHLLFFFFWVRSSVFLFRFLIDCFCMGCFVLSFFIILFFDNCWFFFFSYFMGLILKFVFYAWLGNFCLLFYSWKRKRLGFCNLEVKNNGLCIKIWFCNGNKVT